MSLYPTIEAALLTFLRAYNSGQTFTALNSSQHDWKVLDAESDASLVLDQDDESIFGDRVGGRGSQDKRQEQHSISVEVYYKRRQGEGGDGAAYVALTTLVAALIVYLNQYPKLNGNISVQRAEVSEANVPVYVSPVGRPELATHLMQSFIVTVQAASDLNWREPPS